MVIKPMIRNNICINAHPEGCRRSVQDQIAYVRAAVAQKPTGGPKRVVVIGASGGYGLATRIVSAFGDGADTLGVAFEKAPTERKPGSVGWYNTEEFQRSAREAGRFAETFYGDAFAHDMKARVVARVKETFGAVDLLVYSLASGLRIDPDTGVEYRSALKPIGRTYRSKAVDPQTLTVAETTIEPADAAEIAATVKIMGSEDWMLWSKAFMDAGVFAPHAVNVAFSYIGPDLTKAIYRDGTIGRAKEHLEAGAKDIAAIMNRVDGVAYVSVNKAVVTRASAVIPAVPLYLALLFKVMKQQGLHEGCIEQMVRLFRDRLFGTRSADHTDVPTDEAGRIRIDDWEMRPDVQAAVAALWEQVTSENIAQLSDIEGYTREFLQLHGFGRADLDYDADVDIA